MIDALRLTESVFGLKNAMEAVIETAMRKTATDGVPVGSELKFMFRLRGGDETANPMTVAKLVHVGDTPPRKSS